MEQTISPLGGPTPGRYQINSPAYFLLQRMGCWIHKLHTRGLWLDVGCGDGDLLDHVDSGGTGVDLNPERLILARGKGLNVLLSDGAQLPFASQSFSLVASMEVLEHIQDMQALVCEVRRVIRPGGFWLISVPCVTLRSWYEMWKDRVPYYCDEHEHYREFSPVRIPWFDGNRFMHVRELDALLEKEGFSIHRKDGVHYLFPQWFQRIPPLQGLLENAVSDRLWAVFPWVRHFPFWMIRVLKAV